MRKQDKKKKGLCIGKKRFLSDWPSPQYTLWLITLFLSLLEEGAKLELEPLINIREPIY